MKVSIHAFKEKIIRYTLCSMLFFIAFTTYANASVKNDFRQFKGKVFDEVTKQPLELVHLFIQHSNINTVTNSEGEFLLKVPLDLVSKNVTVTHLGYVSKVIPISEFNTDNNKIYLKASAIQLADINLENLKDAEGLVKSVFKNKSDNYLDKNSVMTAFYRETIKKGKKNVSLSEAIVNIYKTPYSSVKEDVLEFHKSRKNTNYSKLDTLALKLQGGPFNTLFVDMVKYPDYIFSEETIEDYNFSFNHSTKMDNKLIYVINFTPKYVDKSLFYEGQLFIDYQNKILTGANYALNLSNKREAQEFFAVKKPSSSSVTPTKADYQVKYIEKDGEWHYGYSKISLDFKVNWRRKIFNSNYSMSCEMAVTDLKEDVVAMPKLKDRIRKTVVMTDYKSGFSDTNFWGSHNIIEPDKSIEKAIKKIQKQLE